MNQTTNNCPEHPEYSGDLFCSFHGTPEQLHNMIFSIGSIILGVFILTFNSITLAFYIKFKHDSWNFISICTIELIGYNILLGIQCFFVALTICFSQNLNISVCIAKYCLIHFIILMIFKVNFCMSAGRLYQVKARNIIVLNTCQLRTLVFIAPPFISIFTFAPLLIQNPCPSCHYMMQTLPGWYLVSVNSICIIFALITSANYFAIYRFVKCSVKSSTARSLSQCDINVACDYDLSRQRYTIRESIHNTLTNLKKKSDSVTKNDKVQVLRIQTFIFFMIFASVMPYFIVTTYEVVAKVNEFGLLSKIRVYLSVLILFDGMFKPILFTYRLDFMKKGYAGLFRMKQACPNTNHIIINNNCNINTLAIYDET